MDSSGSVTFEDVSVSATDFVSGAANYICGTNILAVPSYTPVVQFNVTTPAITLSASSATFGSTLSATASGFGATESVELHLLKNPSSAPADCDAIRNDASSEELGSATASGGAATISGIDVDSSFVRGSNNHLCLHGASSGASSPVVTFEATPPSP